MTFTEIRKAPIIWEINQKLIPVTQLDFSEESISLFNDIVTKANNNKFNQIIRTNRGSISYSKLISPAYDVRATSSLIELTWIGIEDMFRLQVRTVNKADDNNSDLSGWKAFRKFYNICEEFGINLDNYVCDNGAEVKTEIEKYIIALHDDVETDTIYKNAYHLDYHSSFPSGLVNTHPEFKPVVEMLYKGRKVHPEYKYILNSTIGYMQSLSCCKAKWATLSRDAINDNNKRIRELAAELIDCGYKVLSYNTDGIWYQSESGPYMGPGQGSNICEWDNDHEDCIIRFKSAGAYEYIDSDGTYVPVVRGRTLYDDIKPRTEWSWGDIYRKDAAPKKYKINEDNTISEV